MASTKSVASLEPTLLARKGGAKPAMRQHLHPMPEFQEAALFGTNDDLGWNDMGAECEAEEVPHETGAEVVSIVGDATARSQAAERPAILLQRARLSEKVNGEPKPRTSALAQGRRAAFTLRLDADRHLNLRLASAVLNRSAQDIVTEALDAHLAALDDIESFATEIRKRR